MSRGGLLALALVALLAGCRSRGDAASPAPLPEAPRFPHASHAELACTECHAKDAVLAGLPARPGADDHAPCDREQCHQDAFLRPPGPLCQLCHERVEPGLPGGTTAAPYPPEGGARALASRFSHQRHLDAPAMEARVGFHVSCTDCHQLTGELALRAPDHATCGRCHAPEAAPTGTPAMDECVACHLERPQQSARRRRLIVGDLRFSHGPHRADRRGRLIPCATCHTESAAADAVGAHPPPPIRACVDCHDDATRVPPRKRMRMCETCHLGRRASLGALAPRTHLPATERPSDHTLAFRRDHGADARRDAARCASCHTFMSGNERATCDECHMVMRPADHVVTWREFDHGPEAATRADRCATCHRADFCTACHQQTPRSHIPLMPFREGGHAMPASLGLRSCVTCHDVAVDCARSGCHVSALPSAGWRPR